MSKERTTLQEYKKYKKLDTTLRVSKYVLPTLPVVIAMGVNWEEWFCKQGTSLPFGLATMLIAVLSALFAYSKSKNEKEQKVSPFFYIGAILGIFGLSFLLLSNILREMGLMFIFVVLGIIGGGFIDQIDTDIVKERKNEYKELVDTNQLDNRTRKKALAKEERRKKAEQERKELEESSKNKQAVE